MAEQGAPGFETGTWPGVVAPVGTPSATVERFNAEIRRLAGEPRRVQDRGGLATHLSRTETAEFVRSEFEAKGRVIRAGHIRPH